MSYEHSKAECDWCGKAVDTRNDIACASCYAALEKERDKLEDDVKRLEAEVQQVVRRSHDA